ncbi:MAG TPA: hypothetical protein VFU23_08850 [Gemmatimonadales bacterium]|nr:hypothetical protein [Gemmatimonadales bacterium]
MVGDDKEAAWFDVSSLVGNHPGWWDVGADGALTVVAPDQGSLKRIRITPGSSTSVETLLPRAKQ